MEYRTIIVTVSVSFVIPSKNRPKGIREAVVSVLKGLPRDGEIVVVDDGSQQPIRNVLADIKDNRLKCFENPGPNGPSAARNYGVSLAQSDLIMFLDDDDLLVEDYCVRVVARLKNLPSDCSFGFSTSYILEPNSSLRLVQSASPEGVLGGETPLKFRQAGLGMGCWVKRAVFEAVGGLDQAIDVNEDTEFSIRLAANGHRCYFDRTPGVVLVHDSVRQKGEKPSITKAVGAKKRFKGFEYILSKHRVYLLDHLKFRRKMYFKALKYRCRAGIVHGWFSFSMQHRPFSDVLLIGVLGMLWLGPSALIKVIRKNE